MDAAGPSINEKVLDAAGHSIEEKVVVVTGPSIDMEICSNEIYGMVVPIVTELSADNALVTGEVAEELSTNNITNNNVLSIETNDNVQAKSVNDTDDTTDMLVKLSYHPEALRFIDDKKIEKSDKNAEIIIIMTDILYLLNKYAFGIYVMHKKFPLLLNVLKATEPNTLEIFKETVANFNTKISSLIDTPLEMYRKNKSQTLIQFKKIIRLGYVLMVLSGYSSTTYQCLRTKINNALDSAPEKQLSSKVCDSDISFEFNLLDSKYISTYKTFYNFIISQRNQERSNNIKVFVSKPIVMDEEDDEYINPTETNPEASIVNPVSNEQESVLPESTNMEVDVNKDTSMSIDQLTSTTNNYSNTIDFSQDTSINNLTVPEGYKLLKKAKAVLQKHMDESNNKRLLNKIDTAFSNMTLPLDPVREFLPPQGLPNTGLNCYLNSVLQCLVRLDALFVCLQDNKSNAACSNLLKSFMTAYKTNIGLSDVLGKISYVSELKTYTIFIDLIEFSLVHG